jgi:hypothetical protein
MASWSAMILLMVGSLLSPAPPSEGAAPEARRVLVDVISINGDEFVIKDESGAESTIHVSTDTEKYGRFQPGDRIEAWVYPDGHAKTIIIARSASMIQEEQVQNEQPVHR